LTAETVVVALEDIKDPQASKPAVIADYDARSRRALAGALACIDGWSLNRRHNAGDEPTRQVPIALAFAASAASSRWLRLLLLRILIALAFAAQLESP
jgi:hypothetical protein